MTTDIRTVGIVGSGQMGNGIGQVAAQAGMSVLLYDISQEVVDHGLGNIQKGLVRLTDRGKLSPDERDATLGRLRGTAVLEDLSGADVIIEAAPEDSAIKEDIFRKLDRIARPEVILASNTSSISLTQLGAVTKRPEKVIGMHFMNPPVVMQLVEIVRGLATADETYTTIDGLARKMGKTTISGQGLCRLCGQPHPAAHD